MGKAALTSQTHRGCHLPRPQETRMPLLEEARRVFTVAEK